MVGFESDRKEMTKREVEEERTEEKIEERGKGGQARQE